MGAEVGVLELQIHDNSEKAASGLDNLASALSRVQKALGSELRLGNTANQIGKIVEKMQSAIPEESVSRIERLANAMEKLSAAGKISIPSLKGLKVDSVKEATKAAKENDPFEATASTVETINTAQEQAVEKIIEQKQAAREAQEAMKGVAESAEKATEETGNLSDAMEPAKQEIQETKEEARQLKEELQSASSAAQSIKASTGNWKQYNPATGQFEEMEGVRSHSDWIKAYDEKIESAAKEHARVSEIAQRVGSLREELDKPINWNNLSSGIDRMLGIGGEVKSAAESASVFMNNMEQIDGVERAMDAAEAKAGTLKDRLKELASEGLQKVKSGLEHMKTGLQNILSPLSGFTNQLWRVAKYRMLRAIIKQISEGFKEGVENYYHYSEAINNGFSAAMDRAATSMQTFRNSIGAAVAPVIEALIPILQQVVTWVVAAINYVNQFLALLAGKKSWSQAIDTTAKAFENTKKNADGTKKAIEDTDNAVKDLLADFDELNIIQSQTGDNGGSGGGGGGGGSGKTVTDYAKMFTEVNSFSNDIKSLSKNLKENFGSIWGLVKRIAAAILAWNVSTAFSGFISTLAGYLGSALVIDIVFKLSKTFTSTFLDTGNEMWLLGDFLVTALGATIASTILATVGAGSAAEIAIPLTFAVSAGATIIANTEKTDVSALSYKSIAASVTAALEGGTAAGYLAHIMGATLGESLIGGAVGALLTFGVAIGLKASAQVAANGKITKESIVADIGSAAFVGAGLSLSHGVLSSSASSAASAGAAGGLITFGVLMGLQASLTLAENGEITEAKVWNALGIQAGSSLLIGAGAAVLGLGALTSAGLAFASFGLFLVLDAIITNNKPKKIMWGDSELTDEQIQNWVNEKMFSVNVTAVVEKINTVTNDNKTLREKIAESMLDVEENMNLIELGLATDETYNNLRTSLFGTDGQGGVIGMIQEYASKQQVTIRTSMTLLPLINENGEKDKGKTADFMKAGLTGWTEVSRYMTELGGQLTDALKKGSRDGLEGYDDELIQILTEKLTNVQRAVTGAQLSSSATGDLLTNLSGLSADDAKGVLDAYEQYKQYLSDGYNTILQEELSSYQGLAAFYGARGEEGDSELAAYYEGLAQDLVKQWPKRLAAGVEQNSGPGKEIIAGKLSEMFEISASDLTNAGVFNKPMVQSLMGVLETNIRESDMQNSDGVKTALTNWLDSVLQATLTQEDYSIVSQALSNGILSYTDLFSQEAIDQLTSGWQGDDNPYKLVIQEAWQEMLEDSFTKKPEKIVAEEAEVEQPVVVETEVVEATVDDEGGFDWSNYDFGAGNFEFELTDFHGAGTMAEWEELWDAMFANGTGTDAAANALRERLDEIVETAFLGTGQGNTILEALKNGDLNYGDVIKESVIQSIEEALGLEYASPEIQEKWNAILDEIFGSPEIEVDPELTYGPTGKTPWTTSDVTARVGYRSGVNYVGSEDERASVSAGVQEGTNSLQQEILAGRTTRPGDIKAGVENGTSGISSMLQSLLSVAQAINNKEFTVNIVPSAMLGTVNKRSGQGLSRVTGNLEAPT